MIVATWNVNSILVRLPQVLEWLANNKPDVLCIQETKTVDEKFPCQAFKEAGYHCEIFGEKAYNGVAVISKAKSSAVQKGFRSDDGAASRRFIEVRIGPLTVANVYIPNGQSVGSDKFFYKLDWIANLIGHLDSLHKPDELLLVCGDFNVAPEERDVYDPVELSGQILFSADERAAIENLRQWGLVDTFRLHNQEAGHYSWWDYRMMAFRRNRGLRIDHIWTTRPLAEKCRRAWIDKGPRRLEKPSDHAPVAAEFEI